MYDVMLCYVMLWYGMVWFIWSVCLSVCLSMSCFSDVEFLTLHFGLLLEVLDSGLSICVVSHAQDWLVRIGIRMKLALALARRAKHHKHPGLPSPLLAISMFRLLLGRHLNGRALTT